MTNYLATLRFDRFDEEFGTLTGEVTTGKPIDSSAFVEAFGDTPDEARFKAEQIALSRLSIKWR